MGLTLKNLSFGITAPPPAVAAAEWPNTAIIDGAIWIDPEYLLDNPFPHRSSKTLEEYRRVEAAILAQGQKTAILVRPAPSRPGFYEICCGHTRRDIAVENGFNEGVKAEILMLSDREMLELAFSENFNRNGLNPLDTTDSLMRIIQARGVTGSIPALARSLQRAESPTSAEELIVKTVLEEFGVGLATFRSWLGILNKPQDVLDAIRDGSLPFSKAVELAKVDDPQKRVQLLERVVTEDIGVRELRQMVAPAKPTPEPRRQHLARLAKAQIPPDRQSRFDELIAELIALIPEGEN